MFCFSQSHTIETRQSGDIWRVQFPELGGSGRGTGRGASRDVDESRARACIIDLVDSSQVLSQHASAPGASAIVISSSSPMATLYTSQTSLSISPTPTRASAHALVNAGAMFDATSESACSSESDQRACAEATTESPSSSDTSERARVDLPPEASSLSPPTDGSCSDAYAQNIIYKSNPSVEDSRRFMEQHTESMTWLSPIVVVSGVNLHESTTHSTGTHQIVFTSRQFRVFTQQHPAA